MGNSSVIRITFLSCCDTEINILFTILLFSDPSLCVLLEIGILYNMTGRHLFDYILLF